MNDEFIEKLRNNIDIKKNILILGKGPEAEKYKNYINENTLIIGINELAQLPEANFGFLVDYEPMKYLAEHASCQLSSASLILAAYPFKKISKSKISSPRNLIYEEDFYKILKNKYHDVYIFDGRYQSNKKDFTPNLVTVTALLKILAGLKVSKVSTLGIGASSGYTSKAKGYFSTQLTAGYGLQIPLLYKIIKSLNIAMVRNEGDDIKIYLFNGLSQAHYDVYISFIRNILMLRTAEIIFTPDASNSAELLIINCKELIPLSKYYFANFNRISGNGNELGIAAHQEVFSFFIDRKLLDEDNSWILFGPKKSIRIAYYQAIYRSIQEIGNERREKRSDFVRYIMEDRSIKLDSEGDFNNLNIVRNTAANLLYFHMGILERLEDLTLYLRTTKFVYFLKQWRVYISGL